MLEIHSADGIIKLYYANLPFYQPRLRTPQLKDCGLFLEFGVVAQKDHSLSALAREFIDSLNPADS